MTTERSILTLILWAICFVILPLQIGDKSDKWDPVGPDAYMRLERVNTLVQTGDWFEKRIQRAGPEEGADIHWTRPLDILILTTAVPLLPFMDTRDAIELGGVVLPAIMSLALVFLCVWAVRPLMQPKNLVLVVLLLAVQPIVQTYLGIGRVDHHALLAVIMAFVLGCLIRSTATLAESRYTVWAGIASAIGLWVSLEFLVVYIPIVVGLGASWLLWGETWRRLNMTYAIAALVTLLVCIVVDTPVQDWFVPRYDRISIAQAFLVLCPFIFWILAGRLSGQSQSPVFRAVLAGMFGLASLLGVFLLYPNLFVGPLAEADPRTGPIWYNKVAEMAPLISTWKQGIVYSFLPVAGLLYCGLISFGKIHTDRQRQWVWLTIVMLGIGVLALAHLRMGLYLSIIAVIIAGPLSDDVLGWINKRFNGWKKGATGIAVRALIIVGPFILALGLNTIVNGIGTSEAVAAEKKELQSCNVKEIAEYLVKADLKDSSDRLRFVNHIDFGPQLVYRTPYHFLAVPYHRNGDSIYDTYEVLTSREFKHSKEILNKYQIDYILLCTDDSEREYYQESEAPTLLYNRLLNGDLPEELASLPVPAPWRLFEYKEAVH